MAKLEMNKNTPLEFGLYSLRIDAFIESIEGGLVISNVLMKLLKQMEYRSSRY